MDVYFINLSINYLINCVATEKIIFEKIIIVKIIYGYGNDRKSFTGILK